MCALVLAATSMVAPPAKAATGDITTFAGGLGQGVATNVSQRPTAIAFRGPLVYTTDFGRLVRVLDRRTGVSRVFAGDGRFGPAGDGGPATAASFQRPQGIAVDGAGNVYISDGSSDGDGRIRRVGLNGIITTIAGGGTSLADGVPATEARMEPDGLAFDAAGNLHVADGSRVRRIDPAGRITTVAGTGVTGPFSGDGGPATSANMTPADIDFDQAGNLYITEPNAHRIRKVDTRGTITLFAGSGTAGFAGDGGPATKAVLDTPRGVAADAGGVVYIADSLNQRVRRIGRDGIITTIAGTGARGFGGDGGPAIQARLFTPRAVAVGVGDVYIADTYNQRIRKVAGVAMAPVFPSLEPPTASTTTTTTTTTAVTTPPPSIPAPSGYWMLGADGRVHPFGGAQGLGNAPVALPTTAIDLEPTPARRGYWVLDSAGHVFAFGDAVSFGEVDGARLASGETAASISATPSGRGYWIFTSRGRVLTFGDAPFLGDVAGLALNGPVLDSVATTSGRGYYMVASDGGIFTFGDGHFLGSMGGVPLNAPVQSLVPDGDSLGYWLVASDGGVFAFDAPFRGSMGGTRLNRPITGMVRYGNGYLMVAEDGGIFAFSDLPFAGSLGDRPPDRPIVSVAAADGPDR